MSLPFRRIAKVLFVAACGWAFTAGAQVSWRFGYEDTWSQLDGPLNDTEARQLLTRMADGTRAQAAGGDVNLNGLLGGWAAMQSGAGQPIDFARADRLVRRLQAFGFSLQFNIRLNATWASADNPDCTNRTTLTTCAPGPAHEDDLHDYVVALVERYDGDGFQDMGWETPDPNDDLQVPIGFYVMQGEIEFVGASPEPTGGYGDAATNRFWSDSIPNLLRAHRIVYAAVRSADPSGNSKVVSSGGVLWDLYNDFPDWPATEGPTVQDRLTGANNHNANYTQGFANLKTMLTSFGNDADGVEADYIGWHPHMAWRDIPQSFAFIREHAGNKPVYVDDMWCNIFVDGRDDAPGNTLFTGGGATIEGDFPNPSFPTYGLLQFRMIGADDAALAWYHARHSRQLTKAFVTAFGEGAERVSISGNADFAPVRLSAVAYINLLGTLNENFAPKPGFYTFRLLVEKLHDFAAVSAVSVANDPRTRVYRFDRPRGPIYVAWSETGEAPPNLDYSTPTGETVEFSVEDEALVRTHLITDMNSTRPSVSTVQAPGRNVELRLGYEPVLLELDSLFSNGFEATSVLNFVER